VLRGTRKGDIRVDVPHGALGDVGGSREARVLVEARTLLELQLLEQVDVDAGLVDDVAARVRHCDHLRTELLGLLRRVDRNVAGTGHDDAAAVETFADTGEHALDKVDGAKAGGLGAHLRTAPADTLAGEHAGLVAVRDALVLTKEIAELAATDAGVASGNVGVLTEVAVELRHEGLAEAHHLSVGLAARVKIRTALAATDRHAREGVLEDLLESEELHDAQVHARVKAEATLVGAKHRTELNAEAAVDSHLTGVVDPRHAEDDLTLGLAQTADDLGLGVLGMLVHHGREAFEHLANGLVELRLRRVAPNDFVEDGNESRIQGIHGCPF